MDLTALHEPKTETVLLYPLKLDRQAARATVTYLAEVYELEVESVEERPRWISIEMRVTLTGDPFRITAFRQATLQRKDDDSDGWIRAVVNLLASVAREAIDKLHW